MDNSRGFTLVELVAVMVMVSIGFVGLTGMFSTMEYALTSTEAQQKTAQYAQACADYILRVKRDNGLTNALTSNPATLTSTMCNALRTAADINAGYTYTLTGMGTTYTSSGVGICPNNPSAATCMDVIVTVTGGGMSSAVPITLVNF